MIPFVGFQTDIMASDTGANEQFMALFMDTYSTPQGHMVAEIVIGEPIDLGGAEGRREVTGRGVAYFFSRACEEVGIAPEQSTAIVQCFSNVGRVSGYLLARRHGLTSTFDLHFNECAWRYGKNPI